MLKVRTSAPRIPCLLLTCILLLAVPLLAVEQTQSLVEAQAALNQGHVDEAAASLQSILAAQPANAPAHQLLCRIYYAQELADAAVHECELAVANAPTSSEDHLWLGRAYGLKASHSSPFTGISLAKKVRDQFEQAARLDPDAPRASSDLGQFYISAPGFAGGDSNRAVALINNIEPRFPAYSHRLRALLAEKQSDLSTAEAEYKSAIAAGKSPATWIDLADFYQRHKKLDQAVAAIQSALAYAPKDAVLVDAASILTAAHRQPDLAEHLLWDYLSSPSKTDEAPAFRVHLQLGKLLAKRGDTTGARAQYAAASALAAAYVPARKAMQSL